MSEKRDIYNYNRQLQLALARVEKEPLAFRENNDALLDFHEWCKARPVSEARQVKYINYSLGLARLVNKPFKDMTKEDVRDLLNKLDAQGFKNETIRDYRITLKLLFRFLRAIENDEDAPETSWFRTPKKTPSEVSTRVILEEDEYERVLAFLKVPQDRAVFTFLYWTAARITEAMSLTVADLYQDNNGWLMAELTTFKRNKVKRTVPIPDARAIKTLKDHLHFHPKREEGKAYVFYNEADGSFDYKAFTRRLDRAVEHAGINKYVHPHFLRHSRLTLWAQKGISGQQLNYLAGWSQSSSMANVYIHANYHLVKDKFEQLYGSKRPKEALQVQLMEFMSFLLRMCAEPEAQKAILEVAKKKGQEKQLERMRDAMLPLLTKSTSAAGVKGPKRSTRV